MKNQVISLFAFLVIALSFGSCVDMERGVGEPITQEFDLDNFDKFTIDASMDVFITQGNEQKVTVTTQPNLMGLINQEVANRHWNIDYTRSISTSEKTIVEITLPDFRQITIDGSGNVTGQNEFDLDQLEIEIRGSGNVSLFGEVDTQVIEIGGSGNIKNFDFIADHTKIRVAGSGNVETTTEKDLNVEITGSGDVKYKGRPEIYVTIDGSGDLIDRN